MANLPAYSIQVYGNEDEMPQEAEELLREELADSRKPLPQDRPDREQWLKVKRAMVRKPADRIGFVEHGFVRPEHRRLGLGTRLLQRAIDVAREEGCQSMRCNVSWENAGELALFKKCGFALACIEDGQYFAAKLLQGYGCNA